MFGYVVANVDALSESAKERYRSVYCGLCRALGKGHGQASRLTLTYDMTFLIILLSALDRTEISEVKPFRCPLHPLKVRNAFYNRFTRYAADMNILLAHYQQMDDWTDDRKPGALLRARTLGKSLEPLNKVYPRQSEAVRQGLKLLSQMEKAGEATPDLPAAAFGSITGAIFVPWETHPLAAQLFAFGDKLGRFIYLMDAAVDLTKDIRREKYNPLVFIPSERHEMLLQVLMADCTESFKALPVYQDKDLLENILYSGVWSRFAQRTKAEVKS